MKRFTNFFIEALEVPHRDETLDIDRKEMPQIQSKDLKHFFNHLKSNSISTKEKTVDPSTLNASQGHFHKEKIKNIIDSMKQGKMIGQPIIVSKDNYVIDGHHRWLAHCNMENKPIKIYHVNKNAEELIDIMNDYSKSFNSKLYEENLDETLKKVNGKWAVVSKSDPSRVLQYYKGEGKPSHEWFKKVERRIQYFKHQG